VAIAGAVVLGLHLHFSGLFDPAAGPEDPYLKALATHLKDKGALFYGAYWCPRCQEQKELFTASAQRLPYVECSPQGRKGPVSLACQDAEIREYPTWLIGSKRHTGVLALAELARVSRFRGPPD
jgi:thiol-disulfide isomerase/thioredoxin